MIDTSVLKQLFEDPVMIRKYLFSFRSDIINSLDSLKKNVQDKNWKNAAITAHGLKSNLDYLNEKESARLARDIEAKCEEEDKNEMQNLYLHVILLEANLNIILDKINNYLAD